MSRPLPHIPEQFAKLAALAEGSTFPAERDTARRKAEALLTLEIGGYERALRIVAYQAVMAKADPRNLFAGFDEFQEIDNPGYMAREAEKRADKRRQQDARRAELVADFGSLDAVLKPCAREKAMLAAVKPWRVAQPGSRGRWTKTIAGLDMYDNRKAPPEVIAALEAAWPMPTTYAEAVAEVEFWERRDDDMTLAASADGGYAGDGMLDMPSQWRMWIVRDVAQHRMELRTLPEIIARMRAYRWSEAGEDTDIENAILRDLEALAARENDVVPMEPTPAPTIRPGVVGQIRDALAADPSRSDRDIARALGCSPTTVGRMRGRMGLAGVRRSVRRGGQMYGMRGQVCR